MAARLSKLSLGGASMVWLTDALFLLKQTSFMRAERLSSTFTELCDMEALTPLGCTIFKANVTKPLRIRLYSTGFLFCRLVLRARKQQILQACNALRILASGIQSRTILYHSMNDVAFSLDTGCSVPSHATRTLRVYAIVCGSVVRFLIVCDHERTIPPVT
jgi:hypothetical protein